jgi:hypothetical protein
MVSTLHNNDESTFSGRVKLGTCTLLLMTAVLRLSAQPRASASENRQYAMATQLIIENPQHLDFPEDQARVLLHIACRVLRKEFHLRRSFENDFRLALVLGESDERVIFAPIGENRPVLVTESSRVPTIYMQRWDEGRFVMAALRVAVWEILNDKEELRMVQEILGQAGRVVPVPVHTLGGKQVK